MKADGRNIIIFGSALILSKTISFLIGHFEYLTNCLPNPDIMTFQRGFVGTFPYLNNEHQSNF